MGGGEFYDEPGVMARYRTGDRDGSDPRAVMEQPAVEDTLGDVAGLRVLDLGCGDGTTGAALLDAGAAAYVGVDASTEMVGLARAALDGRPATVRHEPIESFTVDAERFDLVVAFLSLHHVEDLRAVLRRARSALEPTGRLLVTVIHPVITSHDARPDDKTPRADWLVDGYFERGPRERRWLGSTVTWQHRTVEDHVDALAGAGFTLTRLRECEPEPRRFDDTDELARRRRVPLFLLLAASAS